MERSLFAELRRRNVFKASVAYLALGWVAVQITTTLVPALNLPPSLVPIVTWIGVIGFPFVIMFSWVYELTPDGLKRESEVDRSASMTPITGRRLDYVIIALLVVAIGLFGFDRFRSHRVEPTPAPPVMAAATPRPAALATPPVSDQSIAVLPFTNLSDDKKQDYFSDGISEELLNLLAKVPQLQVTARTSSFYFKGKDVSIADIASKLHVAHVLEGSVQKAGNEVRITVQLVDAGSDTQRWSQTWDRQLDDIFKIQDEIAGEVVKELKVRLLGATPTARPTDPQAYALYLQARELGRLQKVDAFKQSDALFEQALAIDPRYVPALTGLAENQYHETQIGMVPSRVGFARARETAEKALAIDPDYAPTHAELGYIALFGEHDLAGATQHLERALALAPGDVDVLRGAAVFVSILGRFDEALRLYEAIVRHDPVNGSVLYDLSLNQRYAGQWDAAIASARTALSLSPGRGQAHTQLGITLLLKGDAAGALAEMEQETSEAWRAIGMPLAYCALGRTDDADTAFANVIAKYEKDGPFNVAHDYAFCGHADKAFEWLDKAVEYKDPGLSEIAGENLFAKIRSDARWLPFLRKLGMAPEQLAKIDFKVTLPKEWQTQGATSADVASSSAAH